MPKPLPAYALAEDWIRVLSIVEAERELIYAWSGLFEARPEARWSSIREVPGLGDLQGAPEGAAGLLLQDSALGIEAREVPQRRGGVRYAIDGRLNPGSVGLQPGGLINASTLVSGQLGTGDSELARDLARVVRREFKKIKSYYVGPAALRMLREGGRLAPGAGQLKEYDLHE